VLVNGQIHDKNNIRLRHVRWPISRRKEFPVRYRQIFSMLCFFLLAVSCLFSFLGEIIRFSRYIALSLTHDRVLLFQTRIVFIPLVQIGMSCVPLFSCLILEMQCKGNSVPGGICVNAAVHYVNIYFHVSLSLYVFLYPQFMSAARMVVLVSVIKLYRLNISHLQIYQHLLSQKKRVFPIGG